MTLLSLNNTFIGPDGPPHTFDVHIFFFWKAVKVICVASNNIVYKYTYNLEA